MDLLSNSIKMEKMNCKHIKNNILFYIDNELSKEDIMAFDAHIEQCNECKLLFSSVSDIYSSKNKNHDFADDPYFYTRLQQKLENKKILYPSLIKRVLQPASFTVLLLMGVLFGVFIGSQYKSIGSSSEDIRISQIEQYAADNYLTEMNNDNFELLLTSNH